MTIRRKLITCLGFLALVVAVLAGSAFVNSRQTEAALTTILNDRVIALSNLKTIGDGYAEGIVNAGHRARNDDISSAEGARMVKNSRNVIAERWKAYRLTKIEGEETKLAEETERTMAKAEKDLDVVQSILERGDRAALEGYESETYQATVPIIAAINKLVDFQIKVAKAESIAEIAHAHRSLIVSILLALGGLLVLTGSLFIVTRKVVGPIGALATSIEGLAQTGGEGVVPNLERRDEIGDIARSVEAFRKSVVDKEHVRAAEAAAVQERVTSSLAGGLSALAGGDLTCTIDIAFPTEYEQLKTDFNATVDELCTTMAGIAASTTNIHGGSGEISSASDDLSRRTEQQAASLEETAAAMTEITQTVQSSAAGASEANKLVQSTQAEAQESGKVVAKAVEAMGEIENSSREITKIIAVIEKIAFQTNLLALNASVEAAHAGDAGKAFAVVANEVRALAQRSADAAQEISELISNSSRQVGNGVGLVGEAGKALERIIGQVDEISTLVSTIAMAADQQSSALAQVNTAITEMDKVTQQNAAMVEESTAAARSLADEATGLSRLVSRFSTGDQPTGTNVVAMPSKPAKPERKPARKAARSRANTAVANEDDWNEF